MDTIVPEVTEVVDYLRNMSPRVEGLSAGKKREFMLK